MDIKPALVKELRERTGAGMMECKKALVETKGDIDAAGEGSGQRVRPKELNRNARILSLLLRIIQSGFRHITAMPFNV